MGSELNKLKLRMGRRPFPTSHSSSFLFHRVLVTLLVTGHWVPTTLSCSSAGGATKSLGRLPMEAVVMINIGTATSKIYGVILFTQKDERSPVSIKGNVTGLDPNTVHGFHIHESGVINLIMHKVDTRDLEKPCNSAGGHFNPDTHDHAGPSDQKRHVGDLGNIQANDNGLALIEMKDPKISLTGPNSIVGRAVVVHMSKDDLGRGEGADSKKTGNAGTRIGCGIIGTIYKRVKGQLPTDNHHYFINQDPFLSINNT